MKKIEAVIKPLKLVQLKGALADQGVLGLSVSEVQGFGRHERRAETYRGEGHVVDSRPGLKVEILVKDAETARVVSAIQRAVATGHNGDGKIFVLPVVDAVRIRTGERGDDAL